MAGESKCLYCGQPSEKSRCKACGANDVRTSRALGDLGPAFKLDWQNALRSKILNKQEFMQLAADKQGSDLQKLMQNTLLDKLTTETSVALRGTGQWKSTIELDEKYAEAKKPFSRFR